MGIFGAVGRETKGALRSLSYDVRHSKRFRKLGTLAVVTVAGGVMATGAMLRSPVPELMGAESDQEDSGVSDGWFDFGSDIRGQGAESASDSAGAGGGESPDGDPADAETPVPTSNGGGLGPKTHPGPDDTPGLNPIEQPDGSSPEESGSASPEKPEPDPTEEPSEEPTSEEPSPEPTETPTETPSSSKPPSPEPSKTPAED